MELPNDFQAEILPYLDESQPTPKETLVCRLLENAWHKSNIKSVLNYLFGINANRFFKIQDKVVFVGDD